MTGRTTDRKPAARRFADADAGSARPPTSFPERIMSKIKTILVVAALAALAAVVPAAVASASPQAGHSAAPAHTTAPKPTLVLVHGAWADASSWAPGDNPAATAMATPCWYRQTRCVD